MYLFQWLDDFFALLVRTLERVTDMMRNVSHLLTKVAVTVFQLMCRNH